MSYKLTVRDQFIGKISVNVGMFSCSLWKRGLSSSHAGSWALSWDEHEKGWIESLLDSVTDPVMVISSLR